MALSVCVQGLIAEGRINQGNGEAVERLYDRFYHQLKHTMGVSAAASEASERALAAIKRQALQRQRVALLQAEKQAAWLTRRRGEVPEGRPFDHKAARKEIEDMDLHRQAIAKQAFAMVDQLLINHRRDITGRVRQPSDLADVVDELHGRDTGSLNAREIAGAWRQTAEWLRSRFNAAGGDIPKLEGWALPQTHDARAVREAGFETWRDFLLGGGADGAALIDTNRMLDFETGLPLHGERLDEVLHNVWQTIATEGWDKAEPGSMFQGAVANAHKEHRILHFADGEGWRTYGERFGGSGSALDAMLAHIERMSRDIAAMERLGPNPSASIKWQGDWLVKAAETSLDQKAINRKNGMRTTLEDLYGEYTGRNRIPDNKVLALGFSTFRSQQSAAKLGGALLSSGGDFATMMLTAGFDGLPIARMMGRYAGLMAPGSMADRALAARLGLVSHEWTSMSAAQWRYMGEELTHEVSRRLAEGVLRASGLARHTEAAQLAFGLELMSHLVTMRDRAHGALDPAFARMLDRYGIDAGRWDMLRASPTFEERGTQWFTPESIARGEGGQGLADDVVRMIRGEQGYAVPEPDLRTRALIGSKLRPGTWVGEIGRSTFLFKGFPLSVILMHGSRLMELSAGSAAKYGLALATMTTMGGALSLQLKALARGQDPQDMTSARFWGAAAVQGGGAGIFGDLLASNTDRFGGGPAITLAGPAAQTLANIGRVTVADPIKQYRHARDPEQPAPKWGPDVVNAITPEVPGLSLWYIRAAYQRTLGDMLDEWADGEGFAGKYRRAERYAQEQGTGYYAPPGGMTGNGAPMRAPDWGNAIGRPASAEN